MCQTKNKKEDRAGMLANSAFALTRSNKFAARNSNSNNIKILDPIVIIPSFVYAAKNRP